MTEDINNKVRENVCDKQAEGYLTFTAAGRVFGFATTKGGEPLASTSESYNALGRLIDSRFPAATASRSLRAAVYSEIAEARAYLIETASPGYTMTLQGPELAIGRRHPEFARLELSLRGFSHPLLKATDGTTPLLI